MEVYIEGYSEEIFAFTLKAFGLLFVFNGIDAKISKYRIVREETEETVAYGFKTYDDALQFIRHHEWILC